MDRISTADRLKQIMDERNLKQVDILKACEPYCKKYNVKMNKSDISQYVSGKVEPSQEKLVVLGMALKVTEPWLMGFNVPAERDESVKLEQYPQNKIIIGELFEKAYKEEESEFIQAYLESDNIEREKIMEVFTMYTQLDLADQGEIRGEMKQMLKANKYSTKEESSKKKVI